MKPADNGKRRYWRSNFLGTVLYCESSRPDSDALLGSGIDISEAGMCMYCSHPLREGQSVVIQNCLPVPHSRATVRWVRRYSHDLYTVGLEFTGKMS